MKKLNIFGLRLALAVTAVIGLAFPPMAEAASTSVTLPLTTTHGYVPLVNVPATIAASTTATNTSQVDVGLFGEIGIQITYSIPVTNVVAANFTIPVYRSIDGTTFETAPTTTLTIALNTTVVGVATTWYTNMNKGAAKALNFKSPANAGTNVLTITSILIGGLPLTPSTSIPTTAAGDR